MQSIRIRMLECGVCLDEMQEPRALDCLHSFCLPCLRGLPGAEAGRLACPHCRRVTRKTPAELERDFRIEQVREMKPLVLRGLEQLSAEATSRSSEILASLIEEGHLSGVIGECDRQLALLDADEAAFGAAFRRHMRRLHAVARRHRASLTAQIDRRRRQLLVRRRWAAETLDSRAAAAEVLARVRRGEHESVAGLLHRLRAPAGPAGAAPPLTEPRLPAGPEGLRRLRRLLAEAAAELATSSGDSESDSGDHADEQIDAGVGPTAEAAVVERPGGGAARKKSAELQEPTAPTPR